MLDTTRDDSTKIESLAYPANSIYAIRRHGMTLITRFYQQNPNGFPSHSPPMCGVDLFPSACRDVQKRRVAATFAGRCWPLYYTETRPLSGCRTGLLPLSVGATEAVSGPSFFFCRWLTGIKTITSRVSSSLTEHSVHLPHVDGVGTY